MRPWRRMTSPDGGVDRAARRPRRAMHLADLDEVGTSRRAPGLMIARKVAPRRFRGSRRRARRRAGCRGCRRDRARSSRRPPCRWCGPRVRRRSPRSRRGCGAPAFSRSAGTSHSNTVTLPLESSRLDEEADSEGTHRDSVVGWHGAIQSRPVAPPRHQPYSNGSAVVSNSPVSSHVSSPSVTLLL